MRFAFSHKMDAIIIFSLRTHNNNSGHIVVVVLGNISQSLTAFHSTDLENSSSSAQSHDDDVS